MSLKVRVIVVSDEAGDASDRTAQQGCISDDMSNTGRARLVCEALSYMGAWYKKFAAKIVFAS